MAIDIRATVTCSLGTLISGSISDDYLQGSGLIKTRGSVEISGTITPDVGTIVTFSYTKGGVTHSIPRKLRVMSSFADPFRRTTKVELGCKLTYLSDLKDPIDWNAFSDPQNIGYTAADAAIVTLPIYASSVMDKCLTQLGILATSNPLTNRFSLPEFDFSAGYVSVLSDLLVSESYFGYLNTDEVLQVVSLTADGGTGPVFTFADIVDLGPIGVGQLPGEAVIVSYSSLILKAPTQEEGGTQAPVTEEEVEAQERLNWESTESIGSPQTYTVSYGEDQSQTYSGASYSKTVTQYQTLQIKKTAIDESEGIDTQLIFIGSIESLPPAEQTEFLTNPTGVLDDNWPDAEPYEYVGAGTDKWIYKGNGWEKQVLFPSQEDLYIQKDVVKSRITETYGPLVSVAASVAADYLKYGFEFGNTNTQLSKTIETFVYDKVGNQTSSVSDKYQTEVEVASSVSVKWADSTSNIAFTTNLILAESTVTKNDIFDDYTQESISTYLKYAFTQPGQQAVAKAVEEAATLEDMSSIIDDVLSSGLSLSSSSVTTSRRGVTMSQERPAAAARTNRKYTEESETANPDNGFRTESSTDMVLALGSASAQRRIELTMPYAPDDTFTGASGGPYYRSSSDAQAKAMTFGRVQNRLLLGNRNGMNLQLSPERIPSAPFDPLYVQANGLTGLYRANGTSWAFDSNGIVASIDALFWGAVGGTGTFWFPVAPGITTLPTTPAIVNGQMNATAVVLPYNETAVYDSLVRSITRVTKFEYSLTLLTVVPPTVIQLDHDVRRIAPIYVTAAVSIGITALAPAVSIGYAARLGVTAVQLQARTPFVAISATVLVPVISISLNTYDVIVPRSGTSILIPVGTVAVATFNPTLRTGASVAIPVANVTVAAFAPSFAPVFATLLYTGTGSTQSITGATFEPGIIIFARRTSTAAQRPVFDYVRGATNYWIAGTSDVPYTNANSLTSFDANGFTIGTDALLNTNSSTNVAWCWPKGSTGSSNTNGSTTTTVYTNNTAGYTIFTYTGTGANATLGHGLGATPEFVILKSIQATINNSVVTGGSFLSTNEYLLLSSTAAKSTLSTVIQAYSSTTVSVGSSGQVNTNARSYIGYAFKSVSGSSKIGTYTGTGTTDQTINLGFTPSFLLVKTYSTTGDWMVFDSTRGVTKQLTIASGTETTVDKVAFNSDSFTVKANQNNNTSAVSYVYLAFR